jgi:hypothetical protein
MLEKRVPPGIQALLLLESERGNPVGIPAVETKRQIDERVVVAPVAKGFNDHAQYHSPGSPQPREACLAAGAGRLERLTAPVSRAPCDTWFLLQDERADRRLR